MSAQPDLFPDTVPHHKELARLEKQVIALEKINKQLKSDLGSTEGALLEYGEIIEMLAEKCHYYDERYPGEYENFELKQANGEE